MTQPSGVDTSSSLNAPDRLYVLLEGLDQHRAWAMAQQAVRLAQANAPKLTGRSASRLRPYYGAGFFGIRWMDPQVWYNEAGTRPRVMKNLAGKTIPMWIDDPTGTERAKNPKAKVRTTASGKQQILIFRKVAKIGATKNVRKKVRGTYRQVDVPASYPGAPGRIVRRQIVIYPGAHNGKIAVRNIGIRWYNPGLAGKGFLHHAILTVAESSGYGTPEVKKA
jgi:hypothetical protein